MDPKGDGPFWYPNRVLNQYLQQKYNTTSDNNFAELFFIHYEFVRGKNFKMGIMMEQRNEN